MAIAAGATLSPIQRVLFPRCYVKKSSLASANAYLFLLEGKMTAFYLGEYFILTVLEPAVNSPYGPFGAQFCVYLLSKVYED